MDLKLHLRNKLTTKLIPLVKKDKCEICGVTDNLEVHHVKLFSDILDETLEELGLEYKKDIEGYSYEELNLITNVILGKHLDIEYLTLCEYCHSDIHKDNWAEISCSNKFKEHYNKIKIIKLEREKQNLKKLSPYIENNIGKKLFKNKREELIEKINVRDNRNRIQKSYETFNTYFKVNKMPYVISSKRDNRRKLEDGTENPTVNKQYWIIDKIL